MKLTQLSAKPQLVKVEITDESVLKEFGESIEFYTWDRQPLDVFMRLANATQDNTAGVINIVKTLILDEHGDQILSDDNMLPTNILMKAISKVTEMLGK